MVNDDMMSVDEFLNNVKTRFVEIWHKKYITTVVDENNKVVKMMRGKNVDRLYKLDHLVQAEELELDNLHKHILACIPIDQYIASMLSMETTLFDISDKILQGYVNELQSGKFRMVRDYVIGIDNYITNDGVNGKLAAIFKHTPVEMMSIIIELLKSKNEVDYIITSWCLTTLYNDKKLLKDTVKYYAYLTRFIGEHSTSELFMVFKALFSANTNYTSDILKMLRLDVIKLDNFKDANVRILTSTQMQFILDNVHCNTDYAECTSVIDNWSKLHKLGWVPHAANSVRRAATILETYAGIEVTVC